jgi:hypothetical protein
MLRIVPIVWRNYVKGVTPFEFRVAFFNALGACMAAGFSTYVDARLTTDIMWGKARHYPLGYWVMLVGPAIFLTTLPWFRKIASWKAKIWLPSIWAMFIGFLLLFNFFPTFPHVNVGGWIVMFAIASIVASWIHYAPVRFDYAGDHTISETARIERVKETVSLWRTVSITITAGYIALLVPWFAYLMTSTSKVVADPGEALLLMLMAGTEVSVFSIWVGLGTILESWRKAMSAADGLLQVRAAKQNENSATIGST